MPDVDIDQVPLPRYNRREMFEQIARTSGYFTQAARVGELNASESERLARALATQYGVPFGHMADTLVQYVGQFGPKEARELSWQLAGRHSELDHGPLARFKRPNVDQWVPLVCERATPITWQGDEPGTELEMLAEGGQPSGVLVRRRTSDAWLRFFAYRVGFNRRVPYDDRAEHFVGLRFWFHLKAATAEDQTEFEFDGWQLSPWQRKLNLEVIRLRMRFDLDAGPVCPYELDLPCFECEHPTQACRASLRH